MVVDMAKYGHQPNKIPAAPSTLHIYVSTIQTNLPQLYKPAFDRYMLGR